MATNAAHRRKLIALGAHQDDLCFICGERLRYLDPKAFYGDDETANNPDVASLDHVLPKSSGGTRALWNTVVSHRQCNSVKNNAAPSDEMMARLMLLNQRRGYPITDQPGTIVPDTFGPTTPAAIYLCDLVNAVPGSEGVRLRSVVARRLATFGQYRTALKSVPKDFAYRAISALMAEDEQKRKPLPQPYENLVHNVLRTYVRREYLPDNRSPENKAKTAITA